jgi:hypothetical protein
MKTILVELESLGRPNSNFTSLPQKARKRRIPVIAGCSSEGQPTTPKPDGAEVKIYAPRCKAIRNRVKIRFLPLAGSGPERGWMRLAGVPVFRSYAAFTGVDPWSVNRSIG